MLFHVLYSLGMNGRIRFYMLVSFLLVGVHFFLAAQFDAPPEFVNRPKMVPPFPHRNEMNFNGRHMPRGEGIFSIVGVKVEPVKEDMLLITLYFSDDVDAESVQFDRVLVNDRPVPPFTSFMFSKTRRRVRFAIKNPSLYREADSLVPMDGSFSLRLIDVCAFDGRPLRNFELHGLCAGDFQKYSRETKSWQKSSL